MTEEAEIVPNGIWTEATTATVFYDSNKYENIPIVRVLWTNAKVAARQDQHSQGVIFLNQQEPPENDNAILLPIIRTQDPVIEELELSKSSSWPQGHVVIFTET